MQPVNKAWWRSRKVSQRRGRIDAQVAEVMEQRALLSATVGVSGNVISVTDDTPSESATLQIDVTRGANGNLEVTVTDQNGPVVTDTGLSAATTSRFSLLSPSSRHQAVSLETLNPTTAPALVGVSVETGDGNDLLVGSQIGFNVLRSGGGNDVVHAESAGTVDVGSGVDTLFILTNTLQRAVGEFSNVRVRPSEVRATRESGGTVKIGLSGLGDGDSTFTSLYFDDGVDGDARNSAYDGRDCLFKQTVKGNDGANRIHGGNGNDILFGGNGNDTIIGASGDDYIKAGNGNDLVYGMDGRDTIFGGIGNDTLYGGSRNDRIYGGINRQDDGTNFPASSSDIDVAFGEAGNDEFFAIDNITQ